MVTRITTVIDPAASYDLVSLVDLKSDLSIVGSTDDVYLARAIEKASLAASQYCGRVFAAEVVEEKFVFNGKSADSLSLSHYPVIGIDGVMQGDADLVEDEDFYVVKTTGALHRIGGCWSGETLTITYEGGYTEIPIDLQGAATDIVKALQFNRTRDPLLRSENILSGLYAYTLFDGSSGASAGTAMQVRSTLDSYRVMSV